MLKALELVIIDCHKEKYLKIKYTHYSYGFHNQGADSLLVIKVHHGPGTTLSVGPLQTTMTSMCIWMHFQISPKCPLLWSSWEHQPVGDFSAFTAAKEHPDEYSLNTGSTEGERGENNLYQTNWHCSSMWSLKGTILNEKSNTCSN